MNKLILILMFALLILPVVTAQLTFKINEDIMIRHSVVLNGTLVDSANITIYDPDNKLLISFQEMTRNITANDFNYSLPSGKVIRLGTYPYTICGYDSDAEENLCFPLEFIVTPSGDTGLSVYYFLIILLSYGFVAAGIWKRDITITLLGTLSLYFVGLWILFNGLDIFKNYLTDGFAWITLGIAFYLSARMSHEYIIEGE